MIKFPEGKQALDILMKDVQEIALEAGDELMDHYNRHLKDDTYLNIENKDNHLTDVDPVTNADHAANDIIIARLKALMPNLPIISEENAEHPDIPEDGRFWTVDPLDGTKGFINKTGGFYVKIALMDGFKPILGVIVHPVRDVLYHSVKGGRAYSRVRGCSDIVLSGKKIESDQQALRTVFNKLHHDPAAYDSAKSYLDAIGLQVPGRDKADGSLTTSFNMAVAGGDAEAYLDCGRQTSLMDGNGYSWDYAPDWLILRNSGGAMIDIVHGCEPDFSSPTQRQNAMISVSDRELGKKFFPKLENLAFNS